MLRAHALIAVLLALVLAGAAVPVAQAGWRDPAPRVEMAQLFRSQPQPQQQQGEQPRRRTLMDMLFGNRQQQQAPQPQAQQPQQRTQSQQPTRRQQPARQAAPRPAIPPPPPAAEKAENATRLAVMGDSMAVDVARALERFYAEDENLRIIPMGVGSSGFVRDDFFDWTKALSDAVAENSFDIAVVIIGINDRQPLRVDGSNQDPLSEPWKTAYSARLSGFLDVLRAANKPVIWVGLPPMEASSYSNAMNQISTLQRLASVGAGAEFLDIYERFIDENGRYASYGPDVNGQQVQMRKSDGIHFSAAGADKVAFYLSQEIKTFYRGAGGAVGIAVADPLAGTDAQAMVRLPYQGVGQIRMLEVAGAVISLNGTPNRADQLATASPVPEGVGFDLDMLINAPRGRADAFGVGLEPSRAEAETETGVGAP